MLVTRVSRVLLKRITELLVVEVRQIIHNIRVVYLGGISMHINAFLSITSRISPYKQGTETKCQCTLTNRARQNSLDPGLVDGGFFCKECMGTWRRWISASTVGLVCFTALTNDVA